MDPVTHVLVGVGVAGLSGGKLSLLNPVHLGAMLGSLAPDLDIIMQLKGDMTYLRHHRGSSHSIPGITASSLVIAAILALAFPGTPLWPVFLWTFLGSVSHIFLDILNSYGVQIFWPLSRKMYSVSLLVLADPVIILLFAGIIFWPGVPRAVSAGAFWLMLIYLAARYYMRCRVHRYLTYKHRRKNLRRVVVLPAMMSLWNWSFLIETSHNYIVGEIRYFSWQEEVRKILVKCSKNSVVHKALQSKLGQLFQNFTPYFHVSHHREDDRHVVCFSDLRYFFREDFLHHATVVLNGEYELTEAVFQPYSKERKIKVAL